MSSLQNLIESAPGLSVRPDSIGSRILLTQLLFPWKKSAIWHRPSPPRIRTSFPWLWAPVCDISLIIQAPECKISGGTYPYDRG